MTGYTMRAEGCRDMRGARVSELGTRTKKLKH